MPTAAEGALLGATQATRSGAENRAFLRLAPPSAAEESGRTVIFTATDEGQREGVPQVAPDRIVLRLAHRRQIARVGQFVYEGSSPKGDQATKGCERRIEGMAAGCRRHPHPLCLHEIIEHAKGGWR